MKGYESQREHYESGPFAIDVQEFSDAFDVVFDLMCRNQEDQEIHEVLDGLTTFMSDLLDDLTHGGGHAVIEARKEGDG